MSVLKNKRSESKAKYINTAYEIYTRTINFLSRLSERYSRLMASDISHTAYNLLFHCETANSIYPSNNTRIELREKHLLEARGALMSLDVFLSLCYETLSLNAVGAFTTAGGKQLKSNEAYERLGNLSQKLGELIDEENRLLTAVLKTNKGNEITE